MGELDHSGFVFDNHMEFETVHSKIAKGITKVIVAFSIRGR